VISLSKHNCMIKGLIPLPWTVREILCTIKIIELTKILMARSFISARDLTLRPKHKIPPTVNE
jgi:hypothetical protein